MKLLIGDLNFASCQHLAVGSHSTAESGHTAAAPPSSAMISRRLIAAAKVMASRRPPVEFRHVPVVAQHDINRRDHQHGQQSRGREAGSEIARPWKMGSSRMVAAPIIAARAVSRMGLNRTAPASSSTARRVRPWRLPCRRKSTSRIEFRTMMPASAKVAVNGAPSSALCHPGRGSRLDAGSDHPSAPAPAL
jgi:hypothetical protein